MAYRRVSLSEMAWEPNPSNPLERKKVGPAGVALLEFAPGFADPSWCERAHVGYIVEGALTLEFEGALETFAAGDAFVTERGTRHRASNRGTLAATVFIVSDR